MCSSTDEKVEMEKSEASHIADKFILCFQCSWSILYVTGKQPIDYNLVSEKTQAVLEYPGVSWKVTKSKFYLFSVGNIALLLCRSSHLLMCIDLKI